MVATHAHADHFGLAKQAVDEGIDVSVHEDEELRATGRYKGRFSAGASDLPMFRIKVLRNFIPMMRAGVMKLDFPSTVGTFTDGDTLDLPGSPTAIHTPGHTEGHVMFHCGELGILFCGDGIATMDLLGSDQGPQMLDDVFHLDPAAARASLSQLKDVKADLLLPGHGQPWKGNPAEAAQAALAS